MKRRLIGIVTQRFDPHADVIIKRLRKTPHRVIRLNFDAAPLQDQFRLTFRTNPLQASFRSDGDRYDLTEIDSIWWRRPARLRSAAGLAREESQYARRETDHVLQGIWDSLSCFWLSRPDLIRRASLKPAQLIKASSLGLRVPRSLITNSADEAIEFCADCGGRVAYKPLSPPRFTIDPSTETFDTVPTTILSRDKLSSLALTVSSAPCLFQEYIPKKHELRITIVGSDLFVAKIASQQDSRVAVDWRAPFLPELLSRGSLPDDVANRLLRLLGEYGLDFGCIDMIVTPDDEYVFLENNPNGQWYFVEAAVPELQIADRLIGRLIQGNDYL